MQISFEAICFSEILLCAEMQSGCKLQHYASVGPTPNLSPLHFFDNVILLLHMFVDGCRRWLVE